MIAVKLRIRATAGMLSFALLAAACGFQLEGSGSLPTTMARTYLDTDRPNSEFTGSLRSALRLRGSEIVSSRQEADAVLSVSEDDTGQRVLSVSARNIPREYEVYYVVTVGLQAGTEQIMEPESLVATRSYTYDETQVLGKSEEEKILRRSLAESLARQVMRRIEAVATGQRTPNS